MQTVPKNPRTNRLIDNNICQPGTPNGTRTIMTMGEVRGIIDVQKTRGLSGSRRAICATMNPKIRGNVMGNKNYGVPDSGSKSRPTALVRRQTSGNHLKNKKK